MTISLWSSAAAMQADANALRLHANFWTCSRGLRSDTGDMVRLIDAVSIKLSAIAWILIRLTHQAVRIAPTPLAFAHFVCSNRQPGQTETHDRSASNGARTEPDSRASSTCETVPN
jgi:hypothetical protein